MDVGGSLVSVGNPDAAAVASLSAALVPAGLAARLDAAALSSTSVGGGAGAWDWHAELQALGSRITRGRVDDAAAARRASEEAERAALRRLEDLERRMVRGQEEETASLHRFLMGWHSALEARLEAQASQLRAFEERVSQASSDREAFKAEVQQYRESAVHACDAFDSRLAALESELQSTIDKAVHAAVHAAQEKVASALDALGREVAEDANRRDADIRGELSSFTTRLSVTETSSDGALRRVTEGFERLEPSMNAVRSQVRAIEAEVETLRLAAGEVTAASEQREMALRTDIRTDMETLRSQQALAEKDATHKLAELQLAVAARSDEHAERSSTHEKTLGQTVQALRASLEERIQSAEAAAESSTLQLRQVLQGELVRASDVDRQRIDTACGELRGEMQAMADEAKRLRDDFDAIQRQGLSHEWRIPNCMQRLRRLSLTTDPGLWLDSDAFTLGPLGPLTLRLYPSGLRSGDGQCAVVLRLPKSISGLPPMFVDLAVGDMSRRVEQRQDLEGGGASWVAEGLGSIGAHTADSDAEDLTIRASFPVLQARVSASEGAPARAAAVGPERAVEANRAGGAQAHEGRLAGAADVPSPAVGVAAAWKPGAAPLFGSFSGTPAAPAAAGARPGRDTRKGIPASESITASWKAAPSTGQAAASPGAVTAAVGLTRTANPQVARLAAPEASSAAGSNVARANVFATLQSRLNAPLQAAVGGAAERAAVGSTAAPAVSQPSQQEGQPSIAKTRSLLEQQARAAFELPRGALPGNASVASSSPDRNQAEGSPKSPTNPFVEPVPTVDELAAAPAPSSNPFAGVLAPAGASNAT